MNTVFKLFLSYLWPYIRTIFVALAASLTKELVESARDIVKELSNSGLSNDEKRALAFKRIKEELKETGLEAKDSIINLLIETLVVDIKK